MHVFEESLGKSHAIANASFWDEVYRQAFPDMIGMSYVFKDSPEQRSGIDRKIFLTCGKTVTLDEKVREKDWPDFLLERWHHHKQHRTPGWIQKSLSCDFVAYAFLPSRTCYLLPWRPLREAWLKYGMEWIKRRPRKYSQNNGWVTEGVCVSREELLAVVAGTVMINWGKNDHRDSPTVPA
jgi:hypothetical protein